MISQCLVGAAVVAAVAGVGLRPTFGGVPAPICRQPDVLDAAAESFRAHDPYARLLRESVTETPTQTPTIVACTAFLQVTRYDAARSGLLPELAVTTRGFIVKRLRHGYEVAVR